MQQLFCGSFILTSEFQGEVRIPNTQSETLILVFPNKHLETQALAPHHDLCFC